MVVEGRPIIMLFIVDEILAAFSVVALQLKLMIVNGCVSCIKVSAKIITFRLLWWFFVFRKEHCACNRMNR